MSGEFSLQEIFLFTNLTPEESGIVRNLLEYQTFLMGEKIVEEGKAGESLFIICSGRVRVTRWAEGQSIVLTELGANDFFGEMSLIDDFPTSATVHAVEDTVLLQMSRSNFKSVVSRGGSLSAKLWESLARSLNMRIRKTDELVKMYHGLNRALCENEQFRALYTAWNFHSRKTSST
jgi:CRP-like cAMP-binding protein